MAEEKKEKKTTTKTTKKTTKHGTETKKTKTTKKETTKSVSPEKKESASTKNAVKKVSAKKDETSKVEPKKNEAKKTETPKSKVQKEVKKDIEKQTEEKVENLEKTLIFDGKENENIKEVVEKLEEEKILLDDKVIKRNKGKNIAIIVLSILIVVIIISVSIYAIKEGTNKEPNKAEALQTINSNIYKKVSSNYKTISDIEKENKKEDDGIITKDEVEEEEIEYKNIITITLAEFEEKILKKEDMTVLVSSTTCYHCITFEPIIDEVFKEKNKKIYRINVVAMSEDEVNRFRTYYAFTKTPTIFDIKDGYSVVENIGTMTKEELSTWVDNNL